VLTYQDVARGVLGVEGQRIVEASIILFQLGVCSVYIDFVALELEDLFPASRGGLTRAEWILALLPPTAAVCCLRYLRDISDVAAAAAACYFLGLLGTLGYCCFRVRDGVVQRPVDDTSATNVFALFATMMYAFEGMPAALCQIENTLQGGRREMRKLVVATLATVFGVFLVIEYLGALAFGEPKNPLTASVYDSYGGALPTVINVAVLISVVLSYPLQFYSAVVLLERIADVGPGATQARRALLRTGRGRAHDAEPLMPRIGGAPAVSEESEGPWITEEDGGWKVFISARKFYPLDARRGRAPTAHRPSRCACRSWLARRASPRPCRRSRT